MSSSVRLRLVRGALIAGGAVLLTAATWAVFRHGVQSSGADLPVLGTVPEFSLRASSGQPLSRQDLAGGVWV
ncbi:MAG: hypothetical protein ACHQIO_19230, partial [Nevskiales bacterium]